MIEQTDRDAALVEELALAIADARFVKWPKNGNNWLHHSEDARAILPIIHRERIAAEKRGREEGERIGYDRAIAEVVAWLRDDEGHIGGVWGDGPFFADAIEARQHKGAV